jgi:hypothetical protein
VWVRIPPGALYLHFQGCGRLGSSGTLTKVDVEWATLARGSDPFTISIARRASVALMNAHVGPKY